MIELKNMIRCITWYFCKNQAIQKKILYTILTACHDVGLVQDNSKIYCSKELYCLRQKIVDGGVSSVVVNSVRMIELCNLLQLHQTVQGQTGCQDNDPSLSEALNLQGEKSGDMFTAPIISSGRCSCVCHITHLG